jgi:uncharacterized protein YjlB
MKLNMMIPILITSFFFKGDYTGEEAQIDLNAEILHQVFQDDGIFPNNSLPAILYKGVVEFSKGADPTVIEQLFLKNNWGNSWRNGIYSFHHYHSTSHEVLGVYSGSVRVRLGGEKGETFELNQGDVVLIPAGVAHKNLGSSADFKVVGAYPEGQSWDMKYGKEGERPAADENIANVPMPGSDPVFGKSGPLHKYWINTHLGE